MKEENLAQAMMEQKRKREAPLPTREDLLIASINNLRSMLPAEPKLVAKSNNESPQQKESRDLMLKKILSQVSEPEKDMSFIAHIPEMHLSWSAMVAICQKPSLLNIYTSVITEIYKKAACHTKEQEHIWLAMDSEDLITLLSKGGMEWSRSSKLMIEQQYPTVYNRIYAPTRCYTFID